MVQMAAGNESLTSWNDFQWRRKMETFGDRDQSIVTVGAGGDIEGIWQVIRDTDGYTLELTEVLTVSMVN
jgi:acid phosphatase